MNDECTVACLETCILIALCIIFLIHFKKEINEVCICVYITILGLVYYNITQYYVGYLVTSHKMRKKIDSLSHSAMSSKL
jgi:hypothetical protein